jgi:hypothetical protein
MTAVANDSSTEIKAALKSPLDRFQLLDRKDLPRGPIRSIKPLVSKAKPGFDPVMTFRQQRCPCPHQNGEECHGCNHCNHQLPKTASLSLVSNSSGSSVSSEGTVAETYNWLINAGVPLTAFDPSPVGSSQDLFECAEDITSLFSDASALRAQPLEQPACLDSPVAAPPSFGFNALDATLDIPEDMLGDLNSAIWGL